METVTNQKELSYSELFSQSLSFFQKNFTAIAAVVTFFGLITGALAYSFPNASGYASLFIIVFIQFTLISIYYLNQSNQVPSFDFFYNLKKPFDNTLFRTLLIYYIRILLWSILLIIPGLIFYIYWSFAFFVHIDKKLTGNAALEYSHRLIKDHWWKVLFINMAQFLSYGFIYFLITTFSYNLATSIIGDIVGGLVSTLFTIVLMYLYLNLDALSQNKSPAPAPTPSPAPIQN